MPIQLRCFNNIWPFFTKVAPLPVWFLHPWLLATNGFYRNYQEVGAGGKMGRAENNLGGHLPPLAPSLCIMMLVETFAWYSMSALEVKNICRSFRIFIYCSQNYVRPPKFLSPYANGQCIASKFVATFIEEMYNDIVSKERRNSTIRDNFWLCSLSMDSYRSRTAWI